MAQLFNISPDLDFMRELVGGIKLRHQCLKEGLVIVPNEIAKSACEGYFNKDDDRPRIISLGKIFSGKEEDGIMRHLDCFFTVLENLGERDISLINLVLEAREHDVKLRNQDDSGHIQKSIAAAEEVMSFWESYLDENSLQDLPLYRENLAHTKPQELCSEHDFVYLAGSTCSQPYTRKFAKGVMTYGGYIVLSALDKKLPSATWQMHINKLLTYLGTTNVENWNGKEGNCQGLFDVFSGGNSDQCNNIKIVPCENELEEGFSCASLLREGIENGEKVALVTNDLLLAERVRQNLQDLNPHWLWPEHADNIYEWKLISLSYRFLIEKSISIDNLPFHFRERGQSGVGGGKIAESHVDRISRVKTWKELWQVHRDFVLLIYEDAEVLLDKFEKSFYSQSSQVKSQSGFQALEKHPGCSVEG